MFYCPSNSPTSTTLKRRQLLSNSRSLPLPQLQGLWEREVQGFPLAAAGPRVFLAVAVEKVIPAWAG